MRVAATDDTLRPGPLASAAGAGDDGRRPDQPTEADRQRIRAETHAHRAALARDLGAIACAVLAVVIGLLSLLALGGWPVVGLAVAILLGASARYLGYVDPTSRAQD